MQTPGILTGQTGGILAAGFPQQGLWYHPYLSVLLQDISTTQQVWDKLLFSDHQPLHSTVVTEPPAYWESSSHFLSLSVCSSEPREVRGPKSKYICLLQRLSGVLSECLHSREVCWRGCSWANWPFSLPFNQGSTSFVILLRALS